MGPPGAGKGTQASLLAKKIGYLQFSTGSAFREISRQDSDLGRRVKETIDNGYLAAPEMAAEVVMAAVASHMEKNQGLIFDGTPRTVRESDIVENFFLEKNYGEPLVIFLDVRKEEMISRNSKRKYCMNIKSDFPIITAADEARCNELGGTVGRRPDDEPAKLEARWQQFLEHTKPVVDKFRRRNMVNEVSGEQSIDEVHLAIMEVINKYKNDKD